MLAIWYGKIVCGRTFLEQLNFLFRVFIILGYFNIQKNVF